MRADRRIDGQADSVSWLRIGAAALVALTVCPSVRLSAQSSPALRNAVQLAAEGRGDSAYRVVNAELQRARPGDSSYVEALFWRARLATFGDSAERDLRRVAIEYSGSPWADDALLQLSQLALTAGNPASAYELAGRLRSDYPGSDLKPGAALWGARAAFEIGEPRAACALLDTATAESADVEFANQVNYYRGRCTMAMFAPASAGRPQREAGPAAASGYPEPVASGRYEVQAAATPNADGAQDVVERLAQAGLRARVVRAAADVHRVRLGPYATQAAADSVARAAARVVGGEPFVVRLP